MKAVSPRNRLCDAPRPEAARSAPLCPARNLKRLRRCKKLLMKLFSLPRRSAALLWQYGLRPESPCAACLIRYRKDGYRKTVPVFVAFNLHSASGAYTARFMSIPASAPSMNSSAVTVRFSFTFLLLRNSTSRPIPAFDSRPANRPPRPIIPLM